MKKLLVTALLTIPIFCFSQRYFEGEILYKHEVIKKDSAFDLNRIPSWPSKASKLIYKSGDFIQWPDEGFVEYQYFNHTLNQEFYKIRNVDTLMFHDYKERSPEQDSILSVKSYSNTDTVLNKICNRLILETGEVKLTFVYNQEYSINPDWYRNTKGGYYNIIYGQAKSVFMKWIIETAQFISITEAVEINRKPISDSMFPNVAVTPKKAL